jgi:hypothetical protein
LNFRVCNGYSKEMWDDPPVDHGKICRIGKHMYLQTLETRVPVYMMTEVANMKCQRGVALQLKQVGRGNHVRGYLILEITQIGLGVVSLFRILSEGLTRWTKNPGILRLWPWRSQETYPLSRMMGW